ncbi:MAG: pentapeptide repeat-containing protein [Clostridia bacterium]|nr:pentapeptide repeat-containing protein [Clostridia bacterium]
MKKKDNEELFELLKIDCKNCFGLCCAALYFSESDGFPEDKKAGKPCINLRPDYTCADYKNLKNKGFKGCLGYDCFGAGQKISQVTFNGEDWMQFPENKEKMFSAFLIMRKLHEMMWYLAQAYCLQTNQSIKDEICALLESIEQTTEGDADSLVSLDQETHRNNVNRYLSITSDLVRGKACEKASEKSIGGADYFGADLRNSNMIGADLRGACLIATNLSGIDLTGADLISADMRDANIKGANLADCLFLTQSQVNSAKGDNSTKLPFIIDRPSHW